MRYDRNDCMPGERDGNWGSVWCVEALYSGLNLVWIFGVCFLSVL